MNQYYIVIGAVIYLNIFLSKKLVKKNQNIRQSLANTPSDLFFEYLLKICKYYTSIYLLYKCFNYYTLFPSILAPFSVILFP